MLFGFSGEVQSMGLLAELSGEAWAIIIGAVFLGIQGLAGQVLSYLRSISVQKSVDEVAVKQAEANIKVEAVHIATNGMSKKLAELTGEKEFLRGTEEERLRGIDEAKRVEERRSHQ
jgi:hypothetical protein